MTESEVAVLPDGFLLGTCSAALATEGPAGRGGSIWDILAAVPGRVVDGSTDAGVIDLASHWQDDLDLLGGLGVDAHLFSLSWPRIQSGGTGPANSTGLDFYDRLVDGMLERGVAPWVSLYQWDLPTELMVAGGWLDRDTAERFGDYAALVADRLGDRIAAWVTMTDPFSHMAFGHAAGVDAPGLALLGEAFGVTHHLLLGHARALAALRARTAAPVGIVNQHTAVVPASPQRADRRAALAYESYHNRQFADPVLTGRYPRLLDRLAEASGVVEPVDLQAISAPMDFYGVCWSHPVAVAAAADNPQVPFTAAVLDLPHTDGGLPIDAAALADTLRRLRHRYPALPPVQVIAGGAFAGPPDASDERRIAYLETHLAAAGAGGAAGYFHRSLTDGWEGTEGYTQHFGLVAVDADGRRRPRAGYRHLQELTAARRR